LDAEGGTASGTNVDGTSIRIVAQSGSSPGAPTYGANGGNIILLPGIMQGGAVNGSVSIGTATVTRGIPLQVSESAAANSFRDIAITTAPWTDSSVGTELRMGLGAWSGNTYGEIDVLQGGGTSGGTLVLQGTGGVASASGRRR
jgi:hypothetical protein